MTADSTAPGTSTTLPLSTKRAAFARLAPHLRGRSGWMAVLLVAGIANAAAGLVGPWAIGRLVDALPAGAGPEVVWTSAIAVALAGLVMALGTWIGAWALARVAMPTVAGLRTDVVGAALALDAQTVERTGTGDLVSRVADDSRKVSETSTQILPLVVESVLVVVVSAIGLAAVDWRLGLVGLVALPMYWLTLRWYLPRSAPLYQQERAAIGRRSGRLLGGLTGARTLRAHRAEHIELTRIDSASAEARDLSVGVFRFLTRAFSRNNRAEAVVLSLLLIAGFALVWFDETTPGAVTTAALVFHRLFNPIGALVGLFDQIQSAGASLTRMVGVIDAAGSRPDGAEAVDAETVGVETVDTEHGGRPPSDRSEVVHGADGVVLGADGPVAGAGPRSAGLVLSDLWYSYDDHSDGQNHVLRGVDLTVAPGEVVAVVGTTGAGKSTLAKIAAGLAAPSRGSAQLIEDWPAVRSGREITTVPEHRLRAHVAMIAQEVHTFVGTIRDNVAMPVPEASTASIERALRHVGADWAFDLPRGLDTVVGDGGARISPLQEQTIALARLVVADPDIVILDEATAEAGSTGAQVLEAAAAAALAGRGALVIAHRLSQAEAADRVLVMEHGAIVEDGTHAQLVGAGGRYATLWQAWAG
ncbi:ABC transporter ATP-binding protein [Brevibacterium jeotgali]|uniref:ATP-binding cassette, subfamily C n=1 Tax=Brevibacterium jeotgali TaxID=1262550 RepID=A0A2H1L3U2_9MICO|nr:ABC transporter ATP-binding protein [Brevibacterium jeotgali]TWC01820.1 ATP-binding cassette subfamily C protein [Brevibacterium jeotgali]SMY11566.1 ATP-binding cassette, subfamily C [Brevibacterium jeotgali]